MTGCLNHPFWHVLVIQQEAVLSGCSRWMIQPMVDHNISCPRFPFNTIVIRPVVCWGPTGKIHPL